MCIIFKKVFLMIFGLSDFGIWKSQESENRTCSGSSQDFRHVVVCSPKGLMYNRHFDSFSLGCHFTKLVPILSFIKGFNEVSVQVKNTNICLLWTLKLNNIGIWIKKYSMRSKKKKHSGNCRNISDKDQVFFLIG